MRVPSATASSTSWVTNSTVFVPRRQIRRSSSCRMLRVCASSAPNGSSISSIGRPARERLRDRDALLHAARELARVAVCEAFEADEARCARRRIRSRSARVHAALLEPECDVAGDRQPREQRIALEHDAAFRPGAADRRAFEQQLARARRQEAADEVEQGALAAAARADDRDELVAVDREVDPLEGGHRARAGAIAHGDASRLEARLGHGYFGRYDRSMFFETSNAAMKPLAASASTTGWMLCADSLPSRRTR